MAFSQINAIAIAEVADSHIPQTISLTRREIISSAGAREVAATLSDKIVDFKNRLDAFVPESWSGAFVDSVNYKIEELKLEWEEHWKKYCKGKDLLRSIYNEFELLNYKDFVKSLIEQNKLSDTEEWQIIKSKVSFIIKDKE